MTFEHAVAVSTKLLAQGFENFCVPASLDAVRQHSSIEQADYQRCLAAYAVEAAMSEDERNAKVDSGEIADMHEVLAEKYFPGGDILEGLSTSEWWTEGTTDPFDPKNWEEFNTPKPEHFAYKKLLDDLPSNAELEALGTDPQVFFDCITKWYNARIGTMIAIDNAFDRNLTVLGINQGESGATHTFGITRDSDKYYVYDSPLDDSDKQMPIEKLGPYTLKELVGLEDSARPGDWPRPDAELPDFFNFIDDGIDKYYAIHLYPAETSQAHLPQN